jgi:F-type H+-transporting ATPase subunit delta
VKAKKTIRRTARQLFRLCLVDGVLDDSRARQVAQAVAASSRRGALAILSDFRRLVKLDRDRHTALVQSAVALDGDLRVEVTVNLKNLYGANLDTLFEQDAQLIGGMRIRVGSDVYDNSVKARLAAIEGRL